MEIMIVSRFIYFSNACQLVYKRKLQIILVNLLAANNKINKN